MPCALRALRQQLAHDLGRGHVAARLRLLAEVGARLSTAASVRPVVSSTLGVDVIRSGRRPAAPLRGAITRARMRRCRTFRPWTSSGQHYLAPAFLPTFSGCARPRT